MIKFFRKIRYDLMEKNKTGKYLKYAIGEIILVVIGILIALSINNWNSNRIQKQKEHLLLNGLNEEFKANKIQLDSVLTKHKYALKSVDYLMSKLPIKNIKIENLDSLSYHIYHLGTYYTFNPSGGVINSLINSSSVDIISNNELRQLIISWNDVLLDYQEEEILARDNYINHLKQFEKKHFNYNSNYYQYLKDPRIDLSILQTLEFDNYVQDRRFDLENILNNSYGELDAVIHTIDKIIELSEPKNND
ncbi:MAG: DUF6090 family protein [Maribacter arcticus]|jgi:hypothetical protein|uniref:DUF6090 family protein n=1 Tax=Maribacter arcticus TaxID=561365 RepID=UPI0030019C53